VELATELEPLWSSIVRVRDLVLGSINGPSALVMSMFTAVELLESQIKAGAANRVCWGACSILVAVVLHFPELDADLEVLGSRRNVGLMEDEADALRS
jgi:hypothetical protein